MAAKASLHSMASNWSMVRPVRSSSLRVTGLGADSTSTASSAPTTMWRMRARIGRPSASATDRSATSMAAAPSLICDELPAVMAGARAGSHPAADGRPARMSVVVPGRIPSSVSTSSPVGSPSGPLRGTGTISAADRPSTVAAWARSWLRTANSSISSRVMPWRSARIWATSNWVMSWPSQASRKARENGP